MRITSVLCALSVALCAACDHPTRVAAIDTPSIGCTLQGMTVSPSAASLSVGDTLRARAAFPTCAFGPPAFSINAPVNWRSSDPSMASVDSIGGLIHARAPGDVTIIASGNDDPTVKGAMALHVTP